MSVFARDGFSSMTTILTKKHLQWLAHVHRLDVKKDYKATDVCRTGNRSQTTRTKALIYFRDLCTRDVKDIEMIPSKQVNYGLTISRKNSMNNSMRKEIPDKPRPVK